LIGILRGIVASAEMPHVYLTELKSSDYPASPCPLSCPRQMHRFYASVAAGFANLPAKIL